jgi:plastocyanin
MTFPQRARRLALGAAALLAVALVAAPAIAADHAVSIVDKSFQPAQLTVAVGDKVTWTVTKSIGEPHSVTSGKSIDANAGSLFDSGIEAMKDEGQTFSYTFSKAGTFDYFCKIHVAEMTGEVIVLAPGQSPPAGEPSGPGAEAGVAPERRLIAGGILVVTLIVLFAAARVWRRMNPA